MKVIGLSGSFTAAKRLIDTIFPCLPVLSNLYIPAEKILACSEDEVAEGHARGMAGEFDDDRDEWDGGKEERGQPQLPSP